MNILVISDSFSTGGLETQIKTYYNNLPKGVNIIFAFGNYNEDLDLVDAKIYTNFSFSFSDTISDLCNDVYRLVNIIKQNNINVIHVHPYYCFYASLFASQLTGVKMVYSYHGQGSFNFLKTMISNPIFFYAFEKGCVSNVLSVSKNGINCFNRVSYKNVVMIPNPIDTKKFLKANVINNHKWALISRIDDDKINEIKKMLLIMDDFDIDAIDIYGDGSCLEDLKEFIEFNNLGNKVKLLGYCNNVYSTVNYKYNGIIGIGRVVLESLIMGFPTILIGYGKVTGFINKDIYLKIKDYNFVNEHINVYNNVLPTNYERYFLMNDVKKNYSIETIMKEYLFYLNAGCSTMKQNLKDLFYEIDKFNNNEELNKCYFHKERLIYNLVKDFVCRNSLLPEINCIVTNADMCYELYDGLMIEKNKEKYNEKN